MTIDQVPEEAAKRFESKAWSSALSVPDFASCDLIGIEPLGYVQGFAVMQWSWYSSSYYASYGGMGAGYGGLFSNMAPGQYSEQWQCPHGFVGMEHRSFGFNYEQAWVENSWSEGWNLAYGRMVEEARGLGAHGIIGIVDNMNHMIATGTAEFQIRGTAVAIPNTPKPKTPFTTYLSGQRLGKLLSSGYVPVSIAAALSSVYMCGSCITHYQLAGTASMGGISGGWTGGMAGVAAIAQVERAEEAAWRLAREHVRKQIGSDVLCGATLSRFEHEAGESDLTIQCTLKGNQVRRYATTESTFEPALVVRLS